MPYGIVHRFKGGTKEQMKPRSQRFIETRAPIFPRASRCT